MVFEMLIRDVIGCRTSSNASRLDGYLATESIPDLSEEEIGFIDSSVGEANFRAFVC